jgi:hypothetical protein
MRSKKVSGKTHGAERPIQGAPTLARPEEFRISKTGDKGCTLFGGRLLGGHDTRGTILFVGLKSECGQSIVEPGKRIPDLRASSLVRE